MRQSPSPTLEGLARAGLANAAYHLDDYETAVREWTAAYPLLKDREAKAWALYRIGVCQQRRGWFDLADQTFASVTTGYAGLEPAARAAAHSGARAFQVQLGVFESTDAATRAVINARPALKGTGYTASRTADPSTGRQTVRVGPIPGYVEARVLQSRLASAYPQTTIVP